MRKIVIPLVASVAAIAFLVWFLSPVQVVKRRTGKLMSTLTLAEGSGSASRQLNVLALGNLISDEVALETPTIEEVNGTHAKDQINSGFSWLAGSAKFTRFEIVDFHSIAVTGDQATVKASLEGVVALSSYRPVDGMYEVELDWVKAEDGWRLSRAKWEESR